MAEISIDLIKNSSYETKMDALIAAVKSGGGGSYTLPVASDTILGGIKTGDGVSITEDGVLSADVTSVNNKTGAVQLSASDVGALSDTTVIPSKTSELTNDSGYITNSALTPYAKKTDVPTKTSQLTNDSGFITDIPIASSTQLGGVKIGAGLTVSSAGTISVTGGGTADAVEWANVLDKPTTIAGYGITDAKIDDGTITLGNQSIKPLTTAPVTSVDGKAGAVTTEAVKYTTQSLSNAQKQQARANIGAGTSSFSGAYSDLTGQPTIPSATSDLTNDSGFITKSDIPVTSVDGKTGAVVTGVADKVSKSGDTMTGDLIVGSASLQTNGSVTGTWLKTTGNTALSSTPTQIAVLSGGWIYSRTPSQIKSDIGLGNVDNVRQYSASNPPPYPVTSVNGQTGAVTVESGTKVTQYTGTLLASGWAADSYGYQAQTITISGLKASYDVDPEWDVALSGTDPDADAALLEGFALIHNYKTGANSLTAQCIGAAPTVNISVKVVVFG